MNTVWETFDFAWGDPAQNENDYDVTDPEADTGPNVPVSALLSIEDGGVSDNESDGIPSTLPEQTPDVEGGEVVPGSPNENDFGVDGGSPKVNDGEDVYSMNVEALPPDSCEDPTEPTFSADHLCPSESPTDVIKESQQFEGGDVPVETNEKVEDVPKDDSGDVPVETNQKVEDVPKDDVEGFPGDLSEQPQPTASMPPPKPVDSNHLERKKQVKARLEELRLGLLKYPN